MGEVHSFEPHYEGSPVIAGQPRGSGGSAVGRHEFLARAGHHLAPAALSDGRNVYERLGTGFTLLVLGAEASAARAFADAAAELGLPLQLVEDTPDGERQRYGAALVLVRPDQFVAWAGAGSLSAPQALALLQRVSGARSLAPA